jgi:hypothetical protein
MVEQCEQIEAELKPRGISFEGFCWYPFIDSTDWCSLVKEANGYVDPQGIYYLDQQKQRNGSELSEIFAALARGEITSKDIPAYRFQAPLDAQLKDFLPLMSGWEWHEPRIRNGRHKPRFQIPKLKRNRKPQFSVHLAKRANQSKSGQERKNEEFIKATG